MRLIRRGGALTAAAALALVVAACAPGGAPTTEAPPGAPATTEAVGEATPPTIATPEPQEPIRIGVITSLTSPLALAGVHVRNGAELAVEEINAEGGINGRTIELIIEDAADSNTTAVNALNKVLAADPVAILGPIFGTQNLALASIIEQNQIPHFYSSGTATVSELGNPWLFGLTPSDRIAATALLRFIAEELGLQRVALEHVNNEYGQAAAGIMQEVAPELGLEMVAIETHAPGDTDMSAQLLSIKEANPDVVMVWAFPADTAVVMKQLQDLDVPGQRVGPTAPVLPFTLELVPEEAAVGWYGEWVSFISPANEDPEVQAFIERYNERFDVPPDFFDAEYYDAVFMLEEVIGAALDQGITDLPELRPAVRDGLAELTYEGLDGTSYAFDESGRGTHEFVIVQVVEGKELREVARVGA